MKCPDCNLAMIEEESHFDETQDQVEIIIRCPNCGARFHGTLYLAIPFEEEFDKED